MDIFSSKGGLDLTGVSEEELAAMPESTRNLFSALSAAVDSEQKLNAEIKTARDDVQITARDLDAAQKKLNELMPPVKHIDLVRQMIRQNSIDHGHKVP